MLYILLYYNFNYLFIFNMKQSLNTIIIIINTNICNKPLNFILVESIITITTTITITITITNTITTTITITITITITNTITITLLISNELFK